MNSVCLDNGLCLSPSNNSLELLSYQGCTWYSGAAEACPGAEYCRLKSNAPPPPSPHSSSVPAEKNKPLTKEHTSASDATGWQYPKGTKWNIIPCPNGKYCCSVDSVSADCCAAEGEEGTFEVSFGRVRDSTTTSYQTNWVTTPTTVTLLSATTYTRTATETVCPTMTETETETLASDATAAAAASTVAPALAARFTA
ncbi:hypothetical protein SLS55_007339 [Diplodia seriata]|uniref:Uncharacterized protein n=1 Tax=Diplodia seriata TaxID=420778 RepID=A0ABR3CBZ7_9PEZI